MLPRGMSGSTFMNTIKTHLDHTSYTAALNDIHSDAINIAVARYCMNIVLVGRSPPIAETEKKLQRKTKVALAQLRMRWSIRITVYGPA